MKCAAEVFMAMVIPNSYVRWRALLRFEVMESANTGSSWDFLLETLYGGGTVWKC
jgi:hypothetical protein